MFPDQDLLADVFESNWISIPWTYNAIKTMRYWHGNFYRDEEVRNLHYICDKPWNRRPTRDTLEGRQRTGQVYLVRSGDFEHVKDAVLGLPAEEADAVTHGWWWEEYEKLEQSLIETGYPGLEYLRSLVDE